MEMINLMQQLFLAVKRLMREAAELCQPTDQYFAQPLEVRGKILVFCPFLFAFVIQILV